MYVHTPAIDYLFCIFLSVANCALAHVVVLFSDARTLTVARYAFSLRPCGVHVHDHLLFSFLFGVSSAIAHH